MKAGKCAEGEYILRATGTLRLIWRLLASICVIRPSTGSNMSPTQTLLFLLWRIVFDWKWTNLKQIVAIISNPADDVGTTKCNAATK